MSDILSDGKIDDSTSGPIPSKEDDRKRNIIAEQKEIQRQDSVGGTEVPPRPQQAEQIQEPIQVAPPLPAIPSFDFNITGSLLEETRETARQATIDVIKNVTINGQGPSIEGSNISFNIPQERPASEVFLFQGVAVTQQQPIIPSNIVDIVVSPPFAPTPPQIQVEQINQPTRSPQVEEQRFGPTDKQREEPVSEQRSEPITQQRAESISEQRDRENAEREERNREIRAAMGLNPVSPLSEPSEVTIQTGESIGEKRDRENAERTQKNTEIRESLGLPSESPMDEKSSSAKAYEAAESKTEEKKQNDPNFDRESDVRQRGETLSEYKERQEKLEEERKNEKTKEIEASDILDNESVLTRDISGPIAVSLSRADGQGKVFAYFRSENSTLGEPTLPKDQYYVGGGLPEAENNGDIIYWDKQGETPQWKSLTAPENATIEFKEFDICENGQSKKYNFVVWKTESTT
jgi:hypothetical protein